MGDGNVRRHEAAFQSSILAILTVLAMSVPSSRRRPARSRKAEPPVDGKSMASDQRKSALVSGKPFLFRSRRCRAITAIPRPSGWINLTARSMRSNPMSVRATFSTSPNHWPKTPRISEGSPGDAPNRNTWRTSASARRADQFRFPEARCKMNRKRSRSQNATTATGGL